MFKLPIIAVIETLTETIKLFFSNLSNVSEKQFFLHKYSPNLILFWDSYFITEKIKEIWEQERKAFLNSPLSLKMYPE